ncbi:MAG: LCP family protein [Thermomicrobiales bacterium]|nr:LCP family protein [Thermomicrobiales bacterium]
MISRRRMLRTAGLVVFPALGAMNRIASTLAQNDVEPVDLETFTVIAGGLDSRPVEYQLPGNPENSDVFMIARMHVPTGRLRVVSVPRDLYLEIPGFGYDKITRAFDFGIKAGTGKFSDGATTMKQTVLANFGITIDAVALATFDSFAAVVDQLGGVEVDNPYDLYDAEFPTIDHGIEEIFYPAGSIHLDGADALKFVRTRHQDGDGGRIMRQQLVLVSLLNKATSDEYVSQLPDLVDQYRRSIRNDIGAARRLTLALAAPNFTAASVEFIDLLPYVYSDYTAQGMWVYSGDWSQIPSVVQNFLAGATA